MIKAVIFLLLFYGVMAWYIWFVEDELYRNEKYQRLKRKLRRKVR